MKNKLFDEALAYTQRKIIASENCTLDEKAEAATKLKKMQSERTKNELKK